MSALPYRTLNEEEFARYDRAERRTQDLSAKRALYLNAVATEAKVTQTDTFTLEAATLDARVREDIANEYGDITQICLFLYAAYGVPEEHFSFLLALIGAWRKYGNSNLEAEFVLSDKQGSEFAQRSAVTFQRWRVAFLKWLEKTNSPVIEVLGHDFDSQTQKGEAHRFKVNFLAEAVDIYLSAPLAPDYARNPSAVYARMVEDRAILRLDGPAYKQRRRKYQPKPLEQAAKFLKTARTNSSNALKTAEVADLFSPDQAIATNPFLVEEMVKVCLVFPPHIIAEALQRKEAQNPVSEPDVSQENEVSRLCSNLDSISSKEPAIPILNTLGNVHHYDIGVSQVDTTQLFPDSLKRLQELAEAKAKEVASVTILESEHEIVEKLTEINANDEATVVLSDELPKAFACIVGPSDSIDINHLPAAPPESRVYEFTFEENTPTLEFEAEAWAWLVYCVGYGVAWQLTPCGFVCYAPQPMSKNTRTALQFYAHHIRHWLCDADATALPERRPKRLDTG